MKRAARFFFRYITACVLSLYTLTIGLFFRKSREVLIFICEAYGITAFSPQRIVATLPKRSYNEIITNQRIQIDEPVGADGNVALHELAIINAIIAREKPRAIFEIGTFDGRTTINMAASSPPECRVFTLDLPAAELQKLSFEMHPYDKSLVERNSSGKRISEGKAIIPEAAKINRLFGDSTQFDFGPYYNKCDLVFVDAAHTFDFALADSRTALKLLRDRKGVILWHDYADGIGVVAALDAFLMENPGLGQAIHIEGTALAYLKLA